MFGDEYYNISGIPLKTYKGLYLTSAQIYFFKLKDHYTI